MQTIPHVSCRYDDARLMRLFSILRSTSRLDPPARCVAHASPHYGLIRRLSCSCKRSVAAFTVTEMWRRLFHDGHGTLDS